MGTEAAVAARARFGTGKSRGRLVSGSVSRAACRVGTLMDVELRGVAVRGARSAFFLFGMISRFEDNKRKIGMWRKEQ